MRLGYVIAKLKCKLCLQKNRYEHNKKVMTAYFRREGIKIGDNCSIYSNITSSESYLISIGSNVTISNDVQFITHDNSIDRIIEDKSDIFGEISVGDNCFIGAHSIILPGVTLGNRVIVGAGSVVTKSFSDGLIVAGNPAKIIGDVDSFANKYRDIAFGKELLLGRRKVISENPDRILRSR